MSALLELGSLQTAELVLWCALAGIVFPLSAIVISKLVFGKKPRHRSMVDCLAMAAIIGGSHCHQWWQLLQSTLATSATIKGNGCHQ